MNIQPALLTLTNARRDLGLTVGSGCMLSPIKSVTAIAGIKRWKTMNFDELIFLDGAMGTMLQGARGMKPR